MEVVGIKLDPIVCITEWIPQHDMDKVRAALYGQSKTRLIGPSYPDIVKPRRCKIGIMFEYTHKPGRGGDYLDF